MAGGVPAFAAAPPGSGDGPIAGMVIKGLIFLPGSKAFDPHGAAMSGKTLSLERVPLLQDPAFSAAMQAFIGQPLTMKVLGQIPALATTVLQRAGHAAAHVSIPQQDITSGVVQVVVTEFKAGAISVEGPGHFSPGLYRAAIGVEPGDFIDMNYMKAGLQQINNNEYRSATIAMRPGQESETADLVIRTEDRLPIAVSAGYNNTGVPSTGRNQWTFGISAANTIGNLDDALSYQYVTGDFLRHVPGMVTHALSWSVIVPRVGLFSLSGNYSVTRPPIDENLSSLGHSLTVSPRFTREVYRDGELEASIRTGYDYKSTNNDLLFGGTSVTVSTAQIGQFELAGLLAVPDGFGRTDVSASLMVSPGFAGSGDASFRNLNPSARSEYLYLRLDAIRTTSLPADFSWWTHATGQIADSGLLPSEQLNAGGQSSVRGYPSSTTRGDAGVMLSNELRYSAPGPATLLGVDWGDHVQPFVFLDYAAVSGRRVATQSATDGTLMSVGPGVRFQVGRFVTLALDAGRQMRANSGRTYPAQFFDFALSVQY